MYFAALTYQHHRLSSQSKPSSIDFVETKSAPTIRHQAVGGLQLLLPNGIRISISNEVNLQLLKSVLALALKLLRGTGQWAKLDQLCVSSVALLAQDATATESATLHDMGEIWRHQR